MTVLLLGVRPGLFGVRPDLLGVRPGLLEAPLLFGIKLVSAAAAPGSICGKLLFRKPPLSLRSELFLRTLAEPKFLLGVMPPNALAETPPLPESFAPFNEHFRLEVEGLWMLAEDEPSSCFLVEFRSTGKSLSIFEDGEVNGLLVAVVVSSSNMRPMKSWQQA